MPKLKHPILSVIVFFLGLTVYSLPLEKPRTIENSGTPITKTDTIFKIQTINNLIETIMAQGNISPLNIILGDNLSVLENNDIGKYESLRNATKNKRIKSIKKWHRGYGFDYRIITGKEGFPLWIAEFDTLGNLIEYRSDFGKEIIWKTRYTFQYYENNQLKLFQGYDRSNELKYSAEYSNDTICNKEKYFDENQNIGLIKYEYDSEFRLLKQISNYFTGYGKKSEILYSYDSIGNLNSIIKYDGNSKIKSSSKWKYNLSGHTDSILYFNKRNKLKEIQSYEYFSDGLLKHYKWLKTGSLEEHNTMYQYDSLKQTTTMTKTWGKNYSEKYEWIYDDINLITQFRYYKDDLPQLLKKYTYNPLGQVVFVQYIMFTPGWSPRQYLWRTTKYYYNEFGNFETIEVDFEGVNSGIIYNYYYEYYE